MHIAIACLQNYISVLLFNVSVCPQSVAPSVDSPYTIIAVDIAIHERIVIREAYFIAAVFAFQFKILVFWGIWKIVCFLQRVNENYFATPLKYERSISDLNSFGRVYRCICTVALKMFYQPPVTLGRVSLLSSHGLGLGRSGEIVIRCLSAGSNNKCVYKEKEEGLHECSLDR